MFNIIIGSVFLVVSIILIGVIVYNAHLNNKNNYWIELDGTIIKSKITKKIDEYSLGTDPYSTSTDINFEENLEYLYEYENEKIISAKIFYFDFNRKFLSSKEKKELISKHPIGKNIKIYLDPRNKKKSFIKKYIPTTYNLTYAALSLIIAIYFIFSNQMQL
jgi:hypothetical protein